jgi:hypothetical protein
MARALGVTIPELLGAEGKPMRKPGPVGKVQKLFDEVSRLPRRQQDKIVEFLGPIVEEFKRKAG